KDQLERDLETKNKELNLKVTQLIEKNQAVTTVVKQLEKLIKEKPSTFGEEIQSIINDLKNNDKEDFWSQFEVTFGQVNQSFYDNLFKAYSNLTNNEKKLSAFLKMNLSTKDISTITHQSIRSIEMARSRMRKKLNLPRSENLSKFLNQF
ncbi:MAG: helix-turn-helix transcriptional regulator, partial [Tangfeifania sp.]